MERSPTPAFGAECRRLRFVEENEPGVLSVNYCLDEDRANGTAVLSSRRGGIGPPPRSGQLPGREGYEFLSAADISSWGAPATGRLNWRDPSTPA
jgi:hypothetical protein